MPRRAVLVLPLLALACVAEPELAHESAREQAVESAPAPEPALAPQQLPASPEEPGPTVEPMPSEPSPSEPPPSEPPSEPQPPSEELAAELPKGPEPGSPESDAELLALLDESTITQDEFAKAFGNGKDPKLGDDEQFVFGAGERTRERSKVDVGAASISAGKIAAADIEALARGAVRDLEVCHAMALSKDSGQIGRVTLTIEFDAAGKAASVDVASKLSAALEECLASVAKGWKLDGGKATVKLPLTLSTQ